MEQRTHPLSAADSSALLEISALWGDRYRVTVNDDGIWCAARLGNSLRTITAESAPEFRAKIADDFTAWGIEIRRYE